MHRFRVWGSSDMRRWLPLDVHRPAQVDTDHPGRAGNLAEPRVHTGAPDEFTALLETAQSAGLAARIGQRGAARVVARDECDSGPAVATGAAEIQPLDRDRLARIAFRAGPVRADLIRMKQAVAVVAARGAEHHPHVLGREGGVPDDAAFEIRREPGDFVDDPLPISTFAAP